MNLKERILAICSTFGVTGHEGLEKESMSAALAGFDEDTVDAVGNRILVRRCGRKNAPRILIDTHFDEIGMLVTGITERGFLRVCSVGGLDLRTLPAAVVRVWGTKLLTGVVCLPEKPKNEEELTPVSELLIDVGYSKSEVEKWVRVGTPVGFVPRFEELSGGRLAGKGFDNKACAASAAHGILSVPREALAGDVYLVLSVHEETDRIGGTAVGGYTVDPAYAMVIDVNLGRTPDTRKRDTVLLGEGISVARSVVCDRALTDRVLALCKEKGLKAQVCMAPIHTGTNTGALHLAGKGIPTVDIGLPLRAMHTYVEMIDPKDAQTLADLVGAFICDQHAGEVLGYEA